MITTTSRHSVIRPVQQHSKCRTVQAGHRMQLRFAASRAAHVESIASREDIARHMLELEGSLPTMSLPQLASCISSCVHTYRAARLSLSAMSSTDETVLGFVDYYTNELPEQSWLLTFRSSVGNHLAGHPAVFAESAGAPGITAAEAQAMQQNVKQRTNLKWPQLHHVHISQILSALAALPIMVVQPLPIGFGTPRWFRPLAAADPAAWEGWLANIATVYAALLDQQVKHWQLQQHHALGATASSTSALVQQHGMQLDMGSSSKLGTFIAAAAASAEDERSAAVASVDALKHPKQQLEYIEEQLAEFIVNLACCMRWSNVNVDDDKLQMKDFRDKVLHCLQQQLIKASSQQLQDMMPQQYRGLPPRPPTPEPGMQPTAVHDNIEEDSDIAGGSDEQQAQQQLQHLALAGSILHRMTFTMLLLLLPPPRPVLDAFFAATAPNLPELFTLPELQGLVRGLLFLGVVPPEPWLRALVDVVRGRAPEMEAGQVQSFVEGFRFFGTKASKAGWLRDVTAQLEEFTLC